MEKNKTTIFVILACILLIGITVSFAYYLASIQGEGKSITLKSKNLKITFTESNNLSGENISLGWSKTSTFTVKNEGDKSYTYNIVIKDLVNTFVTTGNLQYKITSTDGGYNMTDFKDIPKSSTASNKKIATNITIAGNGTHTYTILFTYKNSEDNQAEDMGKTLSGQIIIDEYTIPTLAEQLLENKTIVTTPRGGAYNIAFTDNTTGTLFQATESIASGAAKTVYYFAGTPTDNWVKFGGFYWRIIRTNHDGSIRMLYVGKKPDTIEGYIELDSYNYVRGIETNDSPKYVGYMYGEDDSTLDGIRANTKDSTIKETVDKWYSNNIASYAKYLSNDAVYCNDRGLGAGQTWNTSELHFAAYSRLVGAGTDINPTYDCSDSRDAFSVNNTSAKLTYPIGLMTADEIVYAGSADAWYALNSAGKDIADQNVWWNLTPMYFENCAEVAAWGWNSGLDIGGSTYGQNGVRPVISIKADALWSSGDGSPENPYEIVYN